MTNKEIYDALRAAGMTAEGACAVMGNMAAESGMKPNIAQRGMTTLSDEAYTEAANNGLIDFEHDAVGYGLCQWTLSSRKKNLLAYAKMKGVSVGDAGTQVEFCVMELNYDFTSLFEKLCKSHDLLQLTQAVCVEFERPAHNNVGTRYDYAQQAFEAFANGGEDHFADDGNMVSDACPIKAADPVIMAMQMLMSYAGYWLAEADGYKSPEFFAAARQMISDLAGG